MFKRTLGTKQISWKRNHLGLRYEKNNTMQANLFTFHFNTYLCPDETILHNILIMQNSCILGSMWGQDDLESYSTHLSHSTSYYSWLFQIQIRQSNQLKTSKKSPLRNTGPFWNVSSKVDYHSIKNKSEMTSVSSLVKLLTLGLPCQFINLF